MIRSHTPRRRRIGQRLLGERGAALVELTLILPVLTLLALGTGELGLAWRSASTLTAAARAGARVAASQGKAVAADHQTLLATMSALGHIEPADVQFIVIYKASAANGEVPSSCLTGSVTGSCNRYSSTDVLSIYTNPTSSLTGFDTVNCSGQLDRFWCPSTRNNIQNALVPLDRVGVYVQASHASATGLSQFSLTLSDNASMVIEPKAGS